MEVDAAIQDEPRRKFDFYTDIDHGDENSREVHRRAGPFQEELPEVLAGEGVQDDIYICPRKVAGQRGPWPEVLGHVERVAIADADAGLARLVEFDHAVVVGAPISVLPRERK